MIKYYISNQNNRLSCIDSECEIYYLLSTMTMTRYYHHENCSLDGLPSLIIIP